MSSPKRFIAGAVCPKCAEMDRLVSYTNDDGMFKECVACGFKEKQIVQIETSELDTRVNHFPESEEEDEVQVVQLISPKTTKH
tara:strand:- start:110023 stop:110271 length:249 start_codon:yes stop_codon:yes gene_type:complete